WPCVTRARAAGFAILAFPPTSSLPHLSNGAMMTKAEVGIAAEILEKFSERVEGIERWLREHHAGEIKSARHLDEGTAERAYWHFGYAAALKDALRLIQQPSAEETADSRKAS